MKGRLSAYRRGCYNCRAFRAFLERKKSLNNLFLNRYSLQVTFKVKGYGYSLHCNTVNDDILQFSKQLSEKTLNYYFNFFNSVCMQLSNLLLKT